MGGPILEEELAQRLICFRKQSNVVVIQHNKDALAAHSQLAAVELSMAASGLVCILQELEPSAERAMPYDSTLNICAGPYLKFLTVNCVS